MSPTTAPPDEVGIIWVASRITQPSLLPSSTFVEWYENTHIDEVRSTGGVTGALRWKKIVPSLPSTHQRSSENESNFLAPFPFLTLYAFPSLNFRHTKQFKGLDGQTTPKGDLLATIFSKAEFATRFCALEFDSEEAVATEISKDAMNARPNKYIALTSFLSDRSSGEVGNGVRKALGEEGIDCRLQIFGTRDSTVLGEFNRRDGFEGRMVFVGVDGVSDWVQIFKCVQVGLGEGGRVAEWGVFQRGRGYGNWEKDVEDE